MQIKNEKETLYMKKEYIVKCENKGYYDQRRKYLKKHKRVSEFDSENLAYSVIGKILCMQEFSKIDCVMHEHPYQKQNLI